MIPINPEAIGDPNQTPVVFLGEGVAEVLGIPDRSAQPEPQTLDTEAIRQRHSQYKAAWTDRMVDHAMAAACAADSADDVPALLADLDAAREELRRVEAERDEVARELGSEALRWRAERDRMRPALEAFADVLRYFVHPGHPGRACLTTGWIPVELVAEWRQLSAAATQTGSTE